MAGCHPSRGRKSSRDGQRLWFAVPVAAMAVLLALSSLPASAYGYGVKEFMKAYRNPKVSRIEVKGDVILSSSLPPLSRNLTILGLGRKRPVIDGRGRYAGIETGSRLTVKNVEFRGFVTRREWGGAAIHSSGTDNVFESCVFRNNRALGKKNQLEDSYGCGGAVSFYDGTWAISKCQFIGNRADSYGGGFYAVSDSNGKITRSTFRNNYSGRRGGAVTVRDSSAAIGGCTFQGNQENGEGGGALSCSKASCVIWGNAFKNNVAKGNGGAIRVFADQDTGSGVFCRGNTFCGNRARNESTSNMYVLVEEDASGVFSFCAPTAPTKTKVDTPKGGVKYGDCRGCPK
ncbi:hypothetical protein CBR_g39883 [Chara braunii]|uniref:Right handed beta helix domain-containing protein n=1 Tax=Chara braunii TaxID=69332 RepID=A0A388LSK3_CHABU|nr:hypothetical protein CBR_g39883 [Chara braunii]|eukprot:GBG85316.1 hypothetical protein CBR_g39883 [Chara braunii]